MKKAELKHQRDLYRTEVNLAKVAFGTAYDPTDSLGGNVTALFEVLRATEEEREEAEIEIERLNNDIDRL